MTASRTARLAPDRNRAELSFRPWVVCVANLKTWGRPLTEIKVTIAARAATYSTGRWHPTHRRIWLTLGTDPVDAIATILHEFAHAAAVRIKGVDHKAHGDDFKERLRLATIELCGLDPGFIDKHPVFQRAVEDAVRCWWKTHYAKAWDAAVKFALNASTGGK